jgi:hypothetical protein
MTEQFQTFQTMFASSSIGQLPHSFSGMSRSEWILDSCASHHMSPDSLSFASMTPSSFIPIMTADDPPMPLANVGSVVPPHLSLLNVSLIPKLTLNLASIGQLCYFGNYLVIFSSLFFV